MNCGATVVGWDEGGAWAEELLARACKLSPCCLAPYGAPAVPAPPYRMAPVSSPRNRASSNCLPTLFPNRTTTIRSDGIT
jgi:hypothetical protein